MKTTEEHLEKLKTRIGDRELVVSVSGGKDSTATCLYLQEIGLPYKSIFFDTGWEHASTYQYLTDYLPTKIGPIVRLAHTLEMKTPELLLPHDPIDHRQGSVPSQNASVVLA